MSAPTFVVGTGRCGSTMLSNMLREHPNVLSLSEFFVMVSDSGVRFPQMFSPEPVDAREFWELISSVTVMGKFQRNQRISPPEHIYPCDSPSSRYTWDTGVPGILVAALPHLSDDPDALFDTIRQEVAGWPVASMPDHFRHLFAWLTQRFDKTLWVERSGASLLMVGHLLRAFPDARFIHMVRDGRDCALSSRDHLAFRLFYVWKLVQDHLGVHPLRSTDRTQIDRVPDELKVFLPESFDAEVFRTFPVPLTLCGERWTQMITNGLEELDRFPQDRVLTLRYEDFLIDAKAQLDTFATFLGEEYVDEDWSRRCAASVRKPQSTWRDLPDDEALALTRACQPGFDALAAIGLNYDY
jgi:Sulfotransferase family